MKRKLTIGTTVDTPMNMYLGKNLKVTGHKIEPVTVFSYDMVA